MMNFEQVMHSKKAIYASLAVILLAVFFLIWLLTRSFVTVIVDPSDASITIDNAPVLQDASGKAKSTLKPGKHILAVSDENYVTTTVELNLKRAGSKTVNIKLKEMPKKLEIKDTRDPVSNIQFLDQGDEDNSVFYLGNDGSVLYKASFTKGEDGITVKTNARISFPVLSDVKEIIWSPKKDSALFRRTDGIYYFDLKKYNLVSQELVLFSKDTGNVAWAPDDSKIAYSYAPANGERSLIFADRTNSNQDRVLNLKEKNIENPVLSWSNSSQYLLIIPRNKDISSNKIYRFDTYTRKLETLTDAGSVFNAVYSPDDKEILYTVYSKDPGSIIKTTLAIMNADGSEQRDLEARMADQIWMGNNESVIGIGYNTTKQVEEIRTFNVHKKSDEGSSFRLPPRFFAKDLVYLKSLNSLFYVTENQIYSINLD